MSSGDPAAPSVRRELQRKAIHMATAVLPVAYAAGAPRWAMVGVTAGLTTLAVGVEVARRRWPAARDRFAALTGPLLRPHEAAGGVAGATWLLAAFCAVCAMTAPPVAIAAMWAVSAGDGAASVVGRAVGRVRWGSGKTLEGSLALALMTAAGAWGLAGWPLPVASGLGLAAALAEAPRGLGDDNLRVAAVVGLVGSLTIAVTH